MGKPSNTRKYLTYPEIPEIHGNTQKLKRYLDIPDCIFRHSYLTRTRPATRYFVQYPTRPDPILKNPTRWALPKGRRGLTDHMEIRKNEKRYYCTFCPLRFYTNSSMRHHGTKQHKPESILPVEKLEAPLRFDFGET